MDKAIVSVLVGIALGIVLFLLLQSLFDITPEQKRMMDATRDQELTVWLDKNNFRITDVEPSAGKGIVISLEAKEKAEVK